jgi:hypothetical protein
MRHRQLKWLWGRLKQLAGMKLTREELLMRLGVARKQARAAWRLLAIEVAKDSATFSYRLDREKLRRARRREGRYLLRTNLTDDDPARLWGLYLQLVSVEEAFRNLQGDLAIRPIFHQDETRIEAHIFIAFLAYCLHVTLGRRLHALAPGLTPRSAIEKFAAVQMIDLHVPTTDGRKLLLTRYTEPEPELALLLHKLKAVVPTFASRITKKQALKHSRPRQSFAVGTPIAERPRTDPYVRLSCIRRLPRVSDGKAGIRPRMKDPRLRKKLVGQLGHPRPRQPCFLTAPAETPVPGNGDVIAECADRALFVGTAW